MEKNSQYLSIHPKENLGQNLLMKKSTFDNYIKFKTTRTTQNLISMVNYTQGIKIQQVTTQMQNYMIGKSRTTKHKQQGAGLSKKYRKIPPNQTRLQTWTTALNYFVERFGGKKLTNQAQIPIFIQGHNPKDHINT